MQGEESVVNGWAQAQFALRSDFEMKGEPELGEWDESSPPNSLFACFYPLDHKTLSELTIVDYTEGLWVITHLRCSMTSR